MRLRSRKWIGMGGTFIVALAAALFGGLNPLQGLGNSATAQQAFDANAPVVLEVEVPVMMPPFQIIE